MELFPKNEIISDLFSIIYRLLLLYLYLGELFYFLDVLFVCSSSFTIIVSRCILFGPACDFNLCFPYLK